MEVPTAEEIRRGWEKIDEIILPLTKTRYTTWLSPDRKLAASIHEADNEIVAIWGTETKKLVYLHPRTAIGSEALKKLRG